MKNKLLITSVLLILVGGGFFYLASNPSKKTASLQKVAIQNGSFDLFIKATGTMNPLNRVDVNSPIRGRMETVLVDEGDAVESGQVIAWIRFHPTACLGLAHHLTKGSPIL